MMCSLATATFRTITGQQASYSNAQSPLPVRGGNDLFVFFEIKGSLNAHATVRREREGRVKALCPVPRLD